MNNLNNLSNYRAGFVGLIGMPNSGKSSLLNFLVDEKVAIVSARPQSTRKRVTGIISQPQGQLVMVDAPGRVTQAKGLNRYLEGEFQAVVEDADVLVAVLNLDFEDFVTTTEIASIVAQAGKPCLAVATKIDLRNDERARQITELAEQQGLKLLPISIKNNSSQHKQHLVAALLELVPESVAPLYDPELYTGATMRELVAEIVREKCFAELHQEVPYQLEIMVRAYEDKPDIVVISTDIVVARESYRPIVLGKAGAMIRRIGQQARLDIEELVGKKVFLQQHVVVKEKWFENDNFMSELGFTLGNKNGRTK